MELLVQKFLRDGGTLQQLEEKFALKYRPHVRYPNLYSLKYNQIESPFAEPLVQECRGLILDSTDNWALVCHSFNKFFNGSEGLAAPIDWSTARVEEKLDGSLMQMYWYVDHWEVASSGTPDASGHVMNLQGESDQKTFADLFWETFKAQGLRFPEDHKLGLGWRDYTFSFEMMTPENRVLVHHPESRLALIGLRNTKTGVQERTHDWEKFYPVTRTFPLQSWDQCMEAAKSLDPVKQEGYVVVDAQWNRIKLKSPQYVALAHLRDSKCSPARLLEVIRANEGTEFLAYFPEWKPLYETIRQKFETLAESVNLDYERLKGIPVQKDFALEAVKTRCSGALFQLRQGRVRSSHEFLRTITLRNLAGLLNLGDVEEKALEE